jgi:hypothetical protein
MKKRILLVLLAVLQVMALLPTVSFSAESGVIYRGSNRWSRFIYRSSSRFDFKFGPTLLFTLSEGSDIIGIYVTANWPEGRRALNYNIYSYAFTPNDTGIHINSTLRGDDFKGALVHNEPLPYGTSNSGCYIDLSGDLARHGPEDIMLDVGSDVVIGDKETVTYVIQFTDSKGMVTTFEIPYFVDDSISKKVPITGIGYATGYHDIATCEPGQLLPTGTTATVTYSGTTVTQTAGGVPSPAPASAPVPLPEALAGFSDAKNLASWSITSADRLINAGVISGYPDNSIRPKANVTRAEFTKMIMSGLKISPGQSPKGFNDVKYNDWYREFVEIASSCGIVNGISDTAFSPNANITRQDLAAIAYRTLIHLNANLFPPDSSRFTDDSKIADYAKDAVYALKRMGIIAGRPDGNFDPVALATREETAKIVCFLKDVAAVW